MIERARRRYEQLKNKTKIDIRDTWENLLNASTVVCMPPASLCLTSKMPRKTEDCLEIVSVSFNKPDLPA